MNKTKSNQNKQRTRKNNTPKPFDLSIFNKLRTQLRYAESYVQPNGNPDYQFRLNSVYDPNYTGVGHQPYGRDILCTLFEQYKVLAVSYKVSVSTTQSTYISCTVVPNNSTTSYNTSISLAAEHPRAITKQVVAGLPCVITGRIDLPTLNGVSRAEYIADDRFGSVVSGNPLEDLQLHVVVGDMVYNTSAPADSTYVRVELIYDVEFSDPIDLSQS